MDLADGASLAKKNIKVHGMQKISGIVPSVTKELAIISSEHHCYSGEKARQQLLMPNTDLQISVKECFEWFQQNGYTNKVN